MKISVNIECESPSQLKEVADALSVLSFEHGKTSNPVSESQEVETEEMEEVESPYKETKKAPAKKAAAKKAPETKEVKQEVEAPISPSLNLPALVAEVKAITEAFAADERFTKDVKVGLISKIKANIGASPTVSPLEYDAPTLAKFIEGLKYEIDALNKSASNAGALI